MNQPSALPKSRKQIRKGLLLLYITDRTQFAGDEKARRRALLAKMAEAARCGIDFIQLREKDLAARDLESLARLGTENLQLTTGFLINSRSDVALACGADGVHLPAGDLPPSEVRNIWAKAGRTTRPLISVSCHSPDEVARAASEGADFAVFAPVFEKRDAPRASPAGLAGLREACRNKIRVLALGGVTLANARACLEAGAAGVAAIRLFQENEIAEVVRGLKS
ncbi:MAG: thiamine phosphate synthase [Terriglobales bacterium]